MKVLIEIDDRLIDSLKNGSFGIRYNTYDLCGAVANGTPLNGTNGDVLKTVYEGMTNGEVIQAMFPNASVYEHGSTYSVNNVFNFNSTWWNAEYKGVE